jgi:hypothetical protein
MEMKKDSVVADGGANTLLPNSFWDLSSLHPRANKEDESEARKQVAFAFKRTRNSEACGMMLFIVG